MKDESCMRNNARVSGLRQGRRSKGNIAGIAMKVRALNIQV